MRKTHKKIRLFLSDRRTLTMLICILLSVFLWSSTQLSKTQQREFSIDISVINIPQDKFLNPLKKHQIKVIVEGKGYSLLKYYKNRQNINVDFNDLEYIGNKKYKLSKNIANKLNFDYPADLKIQNTYSDTILLDLEKKYTKKIPVDVRLKANFQKEHQLTELIIEPDSVDIQGVRTALDTIHSVMVALHEKKEISHSFNRNFQLKNTQYTKFNPDEITIKAFVDKVSEQVLQVPIRVKNSPEDSHIKIFPQEINILCVGDLNILKKIHPNDIIIEADFLKKQNNTIPLSIKTELKRVKLSFLNENNVEFLTRKIQ